MVRLRRRLSCSFCHRKESEVAKLVAGGGLLREVFICDRCVAVADGIMKSHDMTNSRDEGASQPPVRTGWFRRLFSGHRTTPPSLSHKELAGVVS